MTDSANINVLYIVGWQRSGTTVLGNALGSTPGVFHTGELTYLFTPTHPAGNECGCGKQLDQCPVWSPALADSGISWQGRDKVNKARLASARMRHTPRAYREWKLHDRPPEYSGYLSDIYQALADNSGAHLVVDSSKSPGEGIAAIAAAGINTHVLHMVRDPRACAYSTSKRTKSHGAESGTQMKAKSGLKSSVRWLEVNLLTELCLRKSVPVERYKRMRYEDLMSAPHQTLSEIASWMGVDPTRLPLLAPNQVALEPGHTVMGNPNRRKTGATPFTLDAEWKDSMNRLEQLVATLPALPLMRRYGYKPLPS